MDVPLAYALSKTARLPYPDQSAQHEETIRVFARALEGMQKEALVVSNDSSVVWRLVCDEGPYLNGTDLAPPPLAFFSAGMASMFTSAIERELPDHSDLTVDQDAYYGMEGSALRGTMTASAEAMELRVATPGNRQSGDLEERLRKAVAATSAGALMQNDLVDTFGLQRNALSIDVGSLPPTTRTGPGDPSSLFHDLEHTCGESGTAALVCKLESAASVFEQDHGAGAALKDEQKRTLLIRSRVTLRADGVHQVRVQIHRPIGSIFQFIVDENTSGKSVARAPDGLSYVSAGIAFCYMTQLGRYAQISKKDVEHYSIVQDNRFDRVAGRTFPVDTHVYLDTTEDEDSCRTIARMAEQTCFLHAACRMSNETRLLLSNTDASKESA